MLFEKFQHHLPKDWTDISAHNVEVELEDTPKEYTDIVKNIMSCDWSISKICRVQNPYLYFQFLLKKEEYETRGHTQILQLFHVTSQENVHSIISSNFDWRLVSRVKYGQGISFSPYFLYANRRCNKYIGKNRAILIADVLVGRLEEVERACCLPTVKYDTTIGDNNNTYVKYYDNEFYPKHVIYYHCRGVR